MFPVGKERWYATGKRKTSVARVWLTPGTGKVYIRKWRKIQKGGELKTITYIDPKTGETVEEPILFSDKVRDGEFAVPYTAKLGRKPFKYTPMEEYFGRETLCLQVLQPFKVAGLMGKFDAWVNVKGGGHSGQAGAIRHGIAKALVNYELSKHGLDMQKYRELRAQLEQLGEGEEIPSELQVITNLPIRTALKRAGMLTRDARKKERKKYGQPGARKRFQYSKR